MDVHLNPTDRSTWEGSLPDASTRKKGNRGWFGQKNPLAGGNVVPASAQVRRTVHEVPSSAYPGVEMPDVYIGNTSNNHYPIPFGKNSEGILNPVVPSEQQSIFSNSPRR